MYAYIYIYYIHTHPTKIYMFMCVLMLVHSLLFTCSVVTAHLEMSPHVGTDCSASRVVPKPPLRITLATVGESREFEAPRFEALSLGLEISKTRGLAYQVW